MFDRCTYGRIIGFVLDDRVSYLCGQSQTRANMCPDWYAGANRLSSAHSLYLLLYSLPRLHFSSFARVSGTWGCVSWDLRKCRNVVRFFNDKLNLPGLSASINTHGY